MGDLTKREHRVLAGESWGISAIVFWELSKLRALGRIELDFEDREVSAALASIHVWPLDLEVCQVSTELDFSSDPADELIAATSVVHGAKLVTRDRKIRASKLVPLART